MVFTYVTGFLLLLFFVCLFVCLFVCWGVLCFFGFFVCLFVCLFGIFFKSYHLGSHILSSWMVHAGCVFVAGIPPSRT